jgi:3-hydroxyisobutyrate dehydrogenase-like beta-hydroxyacid dehydrogenase
MVACGTAAADVAGPLNPLGAQIAVLDAPAGTAATRKLLRSIFFKGMAASVVEALRTAERYGLDDWLRAHIAAEFVAADAAFAERLERGTYQHAARRAEEMAAAVELTLAVGVEPHVGVAARDSLRALAATSFPPSPSSEARPVVEIPTQPDGEDEQAVRGVLETHRPQ